MSDRPWPVARLTWFFDFISPYAYLQFAAYPDLMQRSDVALTPILFAGLLGHWGHKGPVEIPLKRLHTFRQVLWLADKLDVPLKCPPAHPFNPIPALRLAIALGCRYEAVKAMFEFIWAEGHSITDEWRTLTDRLGVRDPDAAVNAAEVKAALREDGERAIAAGVFGVPTFVVEGQAFWGLDATAMLRDYLADPQLFDSPEMKRIATLPAAATRI